MPPPPPMRYVAGLFEPLVATGAVTDLENKHLDSALRQFRDTPKQAGEKGDFSDYAKPLIAFIDAHPSSNWNAALHTDLGLGFYASGYYSRAFTALENAWRLGRGASSPQVRFMIDRAVGELAKMHARVGHEKELEALIEDIGDRPMGGPGVQTLEAAKEGLSFFRNHPELSYLCGPFALRSVLVSLKASAAQLQIASEARSGPHGFSLAQLAALAEKAKFNYALIYRSPGSPVPVPSIVNWRTHHYAAITGAIRGHYTLNDPTFGDGAREVTQNAIDTESSGYFLVPSSVAALHARDWRRVGAASAEAEEVYGMGRPDGYVEGCTKCSDLGTPGQPPRMPGSAPYTGPGGACSTCSLQQKGMTTASVTPMAVSLHLEDTPVGYVPQIGLPNQDTINYNSREAGQPANFTFSNIGHNWSHGWQAYVVDNPGQANFNPNRIAAGGGAYVLFASCASTGACTPETPDNSMLSRNPGEPLVSWVRNLPDGSQEIYGLSNDATSSIRYSFLTQAIDPHGNITTITYNTSNFTVTSITDAMGRSTTFSYDVPNYPLLISRITDPFGRTTQLTYDTSERLSSITDPVGITSTFTYSPTETTFIASLTTPYGTSNFSDGVNPNDVPYTGQVSRSLTLTDPLGNTEYVYFYNNTSVTPASDPPTTVPSGMPWITNSLLEWRNTYYWNRHAFAVCEASGGCTISGGVVQSEDFSKAALTHWFHWFDPNEAAYSQISSVKQPLENRFWFDVYNSSGGVNSGSLDEPTEMGRVLDNGTTQLSSATYQKPVHSNTVSPWPLSITDPLGRVTQYAYATNYIDLAANYIDLLTVQQKTSSKSFTTIATYGSYNTQHEPLTYTGADGQTWHYTYNTMGQLATVTDPDGGVTTYNYDSIGRLSTVVDANNVTVLTLTYDSADRIHTRNDCQPTCARGYVLTYAYDNLDRITSITYPDSTTDLYDYTFQSGPLTGTPSLELRKHTDRLGRVTTYGYDADRRLTSVTEPLTSTSTRTTNYAYYEDGTLKDIIDANGNDTHWDIDLESRPIDKIYAYGTPEAQTETYTYENTTSRLHSITDALGQVKTFSYANDDRLTGIAYTNTVNPTPNVTFTWDPYFPRLASMTDGLGTTNYSYTPVGALGGLQLSSIDGPYSNDVIGLTYDTLGRLAGRNIPGGNETFGYDPISRLISHGTPLGSFTYGYLGETDQTTSRSVTNAATTVSTNWGYATNVNDRRLISITNSGVARSYRFGYAVPQQGINNPYDIMAIADVSRSGNPFASQNHGYAYDESDRLLSAGGTTAGKDSYVYDNLDNPTTVSLPSGTVNPTYNFLNQIGMWGSKKYAYDADGNLLSGDGSRSYKWDAENRLVEIDYVGSAAKSQFSYDGMGHRLVDVETRGGRNDDDHALSLVRLRHLPGPRRLRRGAEARSR